MKTQQTIHLTGMVPGLGGLEPVTCQNCAEVVEFHGMFRGAKIVVRLDSMQVGANGKAIALLEKHPTMNIWQGISNKGNKIHFSKKKMVATLIVWC